MADEMRQVGRYGSQVSLAGNAEPPATDAQLASPALSHDSRFQEGPFGDEHAVDREENNDALAAPAGAATTDVAAGTAASRLQRPNPPNVPFYRRPGWWKSRNVLICQGVTAALGIALLFIILFPVVKAIAQHVVNVSVLNVDQAAITNPQNTSFTLSLQGVVTHTGIFSAKITFTEPVNVSWVENGTDVPLGIMSLNVPLQASHKRATLNQTTQFNITDQDAFGRFTAAMITQPNFTWHLVSNGLRVNALKFPVATGIHFNKMVTLNGINNFDGNVLLQNFQLPSDAPNGAGINFIAVTGLNNTSPFNVDLGTVVFNLFYQNVLLGAGTGQNTKIQPGSNSIELDGVLVPHNSSTELATVSTLFTSYLNGETSPVVAIGQSAKQSDGSLVSWLSAGVQSLQLNVPFKNPDTNGPLGPIKSISIGDMALAFSESNPWAPVANTKTVQARMQLPFGFGLSIGEIMNSFNISQNGSDIAALSTPLGASSSDIRVMNSTDTEGTINITIIDTPLEVGNDAHDLFSQFNTDLTDLSQSKFQLVGHARALANLSIGQLTLDPIQFNVTSGLEGLRGLKGDTVITGVDVVGGTPADTPGGAVLLAINVSIFNPSNLRLSTGDLSLQLFRDGGLLGTTLLPNLTLEMGNNSLLAQGFFQPNTNDQGKQTLDDFVGKKDVNLSIAGYSGSTNISSLSQAFNTLNIGAVLPSLKSNLLSSASLEVLSTTGHTNNISHVTVALANPFTAGLQISQITSSVTSHGINLGSISQNTSFPAGGKATSTSPALELDMNLDPPSIFSVTRALAVDAGLDTDQLDAIVALGGYQFLPTTDEDGPSGSGNGSSKRSVSVPSGMDVGLVKRNLFTGFNLPNFVDAAFKQLRSDVSLSSVVTIGEYTTTLDYTQTDVPVTTDSSLNMLLPILAQPIVQTIVDGSNLGISTVTITNPQQTSFGTKLLGNITNAGPFDAVISFGSGLIISWAGKPLGTIAMPNVSLTGDVGAQLDVTANFAVADVVHLTNFTTTLLTTESFEWEISGENLTVSAIGIDVPGISLTTKTVTLAGMNNLQGGVVVNSFDLPANDPEGGIHLTLNTTVHNPSQVGIELSSIGFNNFFESTFIGPAESESSFTLAPQSTIDLPLVGRLVPQNDSTGLAAVSTIFNSFIHGEDSNVTVVGASAGPSDVTWLNEGIKRLQVATVLPNQGKLNIIKSISLNELELLFSTQDAYDPPTSSDDATAAFTIPFAFPIDIVALEQNITAGFQGTDFAELQIPKGPSTTDVEARIIHLTFNNTPFAVFDSAHSVFQQFLAATTVNANESFSLHGSANTDASTAVGLLSLTDIEFSVTTTIAGLDGLDTRPAQVFDLDVNHGFTDFLLIKVTTQLFNPSNLTIGTGDVSFALQFEDTTIGSALISDLIITPGNGNYSTDVHYQPQGSAVSVGETLLENFLQGIDSDTTILGSSDTTPIDSLKLALSEIKLTPVVIPALHQNLVTGASLVFPENIAQTGIASSTFTISNPFTAAINLLEVNAVVTFENLTLGSIDHADLSSDPVHADGHTNVTSQSLPFDFNLDPVTIIELLLIRSQQAGVDLGPLPGLFQVVLDNPNAKTNVNATVDTSPPTCVSGKQFDVDDAILNALKGLEVDLAISSSLKLDDFATDLSFNQSNVPAQTDDTALFLISVVAPPIVQSIVDGADLVFTEANISDISDGGFNLGLKGSLTNTGPLDAEITFVEPVTVNWEGRDIATIALPPVCAAANSGVPDYTPSGALTITDESAFTDFATFLLHNPSFTWTISTAALRVTALGTIFDNVALTKNVTLKAFNGLPGVTISNFQLPSDDPAGGIHIETDSMIPSPAQLGIGLGTVTFNAFFDGVLVGPLEGTGLTLAPESTTTEHLSGRIVPQSGSELDTIGVLFSNFLAGENQTLNVVGDTVEPDGSTSVSWLSTAFKTLKLNVTLPGQKFTIIESITIDDLEIVMTDDSEAFAPLASSKDTLATYKNPFGFSLAVVQSGENITLASGGTGVATLNLPMAAVDGGVSTGNIADLPLSFSNQTLQSANNGAFGLFFTAVTDTSSVTFELEGTANVVAKTTIGDIPISGIPFDVQSSMKGIDSFGGTAKLSNVSITGSGGNGGDQFITSPLTTTLNNPSNISLMTTDMELPVAFKGVTIGRAAFETLNLVPGENTIPTVFHYEPANANDTTAQSFLTEFLTTGDALDLTITGDSNSSPFAPLDEALEGIKIETSLTGIDFPTFLTHIEVFITLDTLIDNLVSINFDVQNPLDADLDIKFVQSDGGVNGEIFAHFDQPFDSFVVPAHGSANSGTFGNVLLTQGALASLGIIPLGELDIAAALTIQVNVGGYTIPWLQMTQSNVPTTYSLSLSLSDMKSMANSISLSAAGKLTSALPSVVSSVVNGVSSIEASVTSEVASGVSRVTSAVSSVVGEVTNVAGSVADKASSVVADVTSDAAHLPAVTSVLSGVGNILPSGL